MAAELKAPSKESLLAIAVVLLPPATFRDTVHSLNAALYNNSAQAVGYSFEDPSFVPHVTLWQCYIEESRLPQLFEALNCPEVLSRDPVPVTMDALEASIKPGAQGQTLKRQLQRTAELLALRRTVAGRVQKLGADTAGSPEYFFKGPREWQGIASTHVKYVSEFAHSKTDDAWQPHCTLGLGSDAVVDQLLRTHKEKVQQRGLADTLAVYHLGRNCTCRRPLFLSTLHKDNGSERFVMQTLLGPRRLGLGLPSSCVSNVAVDPWGNLIIGSCGQVATIWRYHRNTGTVETLLPPSGRRMCASPTVGRSGRLFFSEVAERYRLCALELAAPAPAAAAAGGATDRASSQQPAAQSKQPPQPTVLMEAANPFGGVSRVVVTADGSSLILGRERFVRIALSPDGKTASSSNHLIYNPGRPEAERLPIALTLDNEGNLLACSGAEAVVAISLRGGQLTPVVGGDRAWDSRAEVAMERGVVCDAGGNVLTTVLAQLPRPPPGRGFDGELRVVWSKARLREWPYSAEPAAEGDSKELPALRGLVVQCCSPEGVLYATRDGVEVVEIRGVAVSVAGALAAYVKDTLQPGLAAAGVALPAGVSTLVAGYAAFPRCWPWLP